MTYYTIRCPYCHHIVERGTNRSKQYGSPIRTCISCGREYKDDFYVELALSSYNPPGDQASVKESLVLALWFSLFIVLPITMFLSWAFGFQFVPTIFIVQLIAFIATSIFNFCVLCKPENIQAEYQKNYQESQARLNSLEYALKLNAFGYDVPEKYLVKNNEIKERNKFNL